MEKIKIKAELPPQRCEICHQADCFDAIKNTCSRCTYIAEFRRIDLASNINSRRFRLCIIDNSTLLEKVKSFETKTRIISVGTTCAIIGSIIGTTMGLFYGLSHWSRLGVIDVSLDIAVAFIFDYTMLGAIIGGITGSTLRLISIIIDLLTESRIEKD
jgi:hypothetical protein